MTREKSPQISCALNTLVAEMCIPKKNIGEIILIILDSFLKNILKILK